MLKKSLISIAIIFTLLVGFSASSYAQADWLGVAYLSGGLGFGFQLDSAGIVDDSEWFNWGSTWTYTGFDMAFSDFYGYGYYAYGLLMIVSGKIQLVAGDPDSGAGEQYASYSLYAGFPFTEDLFTRGDILDTIYMNGVSAYFKDVLGAGGTFYFYNGRHFLANVAHYSPFSYTAGRDFIIASHAIGLSFNLGMMTLDFSIGRQNNTSGVNTDGITGDDQFIDYYYLALELEKLTLGPATINFGLRYVQANTSVGSPNYYDTAIDELLIDVAQIRFLLDLSVDLDIIFIELTTQYRLGIAGGATTNEGSSDLNLQLTFALDMAPLSISLGYAMTGSNYSITQFYGFGDVADRAIDTTNGFQLKNMSLELWVNFDLGFAYIDLIYFVGVGMNYANLLYIGSLAVFGYTTDAAIDFADTTQVMEFHFNMYLFGGQDAIFTFLVGVTNYSDNDLFGLIGSGSYGALYFGLGFSTYISD
jgi:hypothetical protein